MKKSRSDHRKWLMLFCPVLLAAVILGTFWLKPREVVYSLFRERGRVESLSQLEGYTMKHSDHFEIYYYENDSNVVSMVMEAAESAYMQVMGRLKYQHSEPIPIIMYPSRHDLRQAFGWGNGESALGVYWSGTIRLLSPNAWLNGKSEKEQGKAFAHLNPIAHELTHYALDYMTSGNYPRWFTEGLAQYIERQVTGYLWIEPQSSLRQPLYAIEELDKRFDQLSNQPLAYRQSYLMVAYIAERFGEGKLYQIVRELSQGSPFATTLDRQLGVKSTQFFQDWQFWIQTNLQRLELPLE